MRPVPQVDSRGVHPCVTRCAEVVKGRDMSTASNQDRDRSHEYGERRQVLVDAVIRLVARAGLRQLTYRSLAKEAGVAHGLIAHHFGSLDALLEEALVQTVEHSVAGLDLRPVSGRVEDFATDLVAGVGRQPEHFAFQYQVMLDARFAGDAQGRNEILHGRYRQIFRGALEDMGLVADPGTVELVYAMLEGVVLHQLTDVDSTTNDLAVAKLKAVLTMLRETPTAEQPGASRLSR